jgi:hypothetical protein
MGRNYRREDALASGVLVNATGLAEIRLAALESDLSRRKQMMAEGVGKESQRDFVTQSRVARNELPWVDDERYQNPNGVSSTGRGWRCNPVGVENYFDGGLTQGSSFLATAGLRAGIPMGFSNGMNGDGPFNATGLTDLSRQNPMKAEIRLDDC